MAPSAAVRSIAKAQRRPALSFVQSVAFGLVAVVLLGAGLRLAWTQTQDFFPLGGDGRWYFVVAKNVADGRGYVIAFDDQGREVAGQGERTAFWPPGYPLALAGVVKLVGAEMTAPELLNVVVEAVTICLIFLLGRALADVRTGLLAATLYALLPEAVFSSQFVMSESLFTTLFMAALLVLLLRPHSRLWTPMLFGLVTGLAVLTRGEGLILLPAALLFWTLRDGWRTAGRCLLLAVAGLTVVVAPWTVRNALTMHAFVPISTNIGFNLRVGHSPDANGVFFWPEPIDKTDRWNTLYYALRPDQEVRRSNIYAKRAFDYATSHPRRELVLAGQKLVWLFRVAPEDDFVGGLSTLGATPIEPAALRAAVPPLVYVTHYSLLALAAAAFAVWLRLREPKVILLISVVALWALFHVAFFSLPRYHLPLLPIFCLAAAWLLVRALPSPRLPSSPLPRGEGTKG